ncbi:formyltransferase family protein [bacterium]|nr:formyltransferase family protein [bacterium]
MKAIVLTSNSLRHRYFASAAALEFDVVGVVSEPKKGYYEKQLSQSMLIREHFKKLRSTEEAFFNGADFPDTEVWSLEKSRINDHDVISWAVSKKPDVVLLFGTAILKKEWLAAFKDRIINLHLGLSPFYRGSATLFWPIHNNELECIGATVHLATNRVDAGCIIGRIKPNLQVGDDYYAINFKAIKQAIDKVPSLAKKYCRAETILVTQDLDLSKLYRKADFDEEALIQALNHLKNGITQEKLDQISKSSKCVC